MNGRLDIVWNAASESLQVDLAETVISLDDVNAIHKQ